MTMVVGAGLVGAGLLGSEGEETVSEAVDLPTRTIEIVGVDGSSWDLTCGAVAAGTDPALWGTAPVLVTADERIGAPGAFVTAARHAARDMIVPLTIGTSPSKSIEENIADLARAVDAVRGDVTVTVGRPDGSRRVIDARYLQGLELVAMPWRRSTRTSAALSLRAHWPYWAAETSETVTVTPESWVVPPIPFNDPSTGFNARAGFNGAASEVSIDTYTNIGDVQAWPTWIITGECGRVSAVNYTTGARWQILDGVADGEVLTVTTRPGSAGVRDADGVSALGRLSDGNTLWTFPVGDSEVALQFEDGGLGASMSMEWTPEYLTC